MPLDSDGDGIPDYLDGDSDNDGIPDRVESRPVPQTPGTATSTTTESPTTRTVVIATRPPADTDGDGIPDYRDTDTDGDGIPDVVEGSVTSRPRGGPNYRDTDSDGDLIPDRVEAGPGPGRAGRHRRWWTGRLPGRGQRRRPDTRPDRGRARSRHTARQRP